MPQKALCIMAAGLGTRFGSLKQLHPLINGFAIIDFSIYDAWRAGFTEIICIIRKETLPQFQKHFLNIDTSRIKITFVFQTLELPNYSEKDLQRLKPWGTGHALLSLSNVVSGKFALINADDFYGQKAFQQMHDSLYKNDAQSHFLMGYSINKTLSPHGSVSRGECIVDKDNCLKRIIERHSIRIQNNKLVYDHDTPISDNTIVSMNFWGFTTSIFDVGKMAFQKFLRETTNIKTDEFYITTIVDASINNMQEFKVLTNDTQWYGITYKQDSIEIIKHLEQLIKSNHYPINLCYKNS